MNMATESTSKKLAGTATGFSLTIGSLGIVFIPPVFGWIVDKTTMYEYAWIFLGILSLSILFLLLLAWRMSEVQWNN